MTTIGQRKILYLVTQGSWGGAQKYTYDLASTLRSNYDVVVASGKEDHLLGDKLSASGIRYLPLKHLVRKIHPVNDLLAFFEIRRLIKHERPYLVHLSSSKAGVLGSLAAKSLLNPPKVIFTMHGLVLNEPLPFWQKAIYYLAEKISSAAKDLIIAVSEADKQAALKYNLKNPWAIRVIPNGLDFGALKFLDKASAGQKIAALCGQPSAYSKYIGTIADFYPTKGLGFLVEAAANLSMAFPDLGFIILGRIGPDLAAVNEKIDRLNLRKKFIILNTDEAAGLLKAFDIFALPSVKEGFPYTVLEAAAAELPIVASRVGGISEILTNNLSAILVPPADAKSLAAAITSLLNSPDKARQIAEQAKQAVQKFDLATMTLRTKQIYEELLD